MSDEKKDGPTSGEPSRTVQITFRAVGPVTRATVTEGKKPDPDVEVVGDALHWIWSWRLQSDRLYRSSPREHQAENDLERQRAASRTSFDEHILVVTGWHLVKALQKVHERFPDRMPSLNVGNAEDALRFLRNLYEHWDEQRDAFRDPEVEKERSARDLVERFPESRPWSITYDRGDLLLGNLVSVKRLTADLRQVEIELFAIEEGFE